MKVFNKQATPLVYGDGKVIAGHAWIEGERADFEHLISQGLVIVDSELPKPSEESASEIAENAVVSSSNKRVKTASIKPMSESSLQKEQ